MSTIQGFNNDWIYKKASWSEIAPGEELLDGELICLPHTWYQDDDYYQGEAVYQKVFMHQNAGEKRIFLKFHGVDRICEVFLNGYRMGAHKGGYTVFTIELTEAVREGKNILTVFVSNAKTNTVSPLSGDFAVFGGIHRKVELITSEHTCFDRTYYGTDGVIVQTRVNDDGKGEIWAKALVSGKDNGEIVYTINGKVNSKISVDDNKPLVKVCEINKPNLWDGVDQTYLYTVRTSLVIDGKEIDAVERKVGFRQIAIDPEKGFFLNKKHLKLHGVAKHQDFDGVFSAACMENWKTDMNLIHEIGANAVRLSHYPHPQEVYDLCDEIGFVVWAEIPLLKLTEDAELFENAKNQLKEMIFQNMHHPSICFWGIQNEIAIYGEFPYMTEKMQALNEIVHELDATRFSTCANLNVVHPDSTLNQVTDTTAYNIYYGWYYGEFEDHGKFLDEFHSVNPNMPLGISEYGADTNTQFHSDNPKVNDYSEEFQALYHETVYPMMAERDFVWGSFVWNMFDFTSPIRQAANIKNRNIKGLVTFDRKTRKDSFYYYKAMWSKEPFVHFASKRYVNRCKEKIDVKVYSNQPDVTIQIGDRIFTESVINGSAVFNGIPLENGENRIIANAINCKDEVIFNRVNEADKSYIYVDQNPGLNVRNWFLDEKEEAELFPEGYLSIRSTINDLIANENALATIDKRMPDVGTAIRDMVGTFTLDKFFSYTKPDYTEEEIKALNEELIRYSCDNKCS